MKTSDLQEGSGQIFSRLAQWGIITAEELAQAEAASYARGVSMERILTDEYEVPKFVLLQALSGYYDCPAIEYDERLPIPPGLLHDLDSDALYLNLWMPVIKDSCGTVVIAANNPWSPVVREEVERCLKAEKYEFRVALEDDIRWYIQDFLHAKPGLIIGTERTGLAYWRSTMAHWRTRLACYRTDLALAMTGLAFMRWGLGFMALANAMLRKNAHLHPLLYSSVLLFGFIAAGYGLPNYLKARRSRMSPPGNHTLIEVTSALMHFLENYHFIDTSVKPGSKETMLARMGDLLASHCTILYPSPASKERTHLARERNVLAAQRCIAACYRTIYSRARTGLAFIRTGITFMSIGIGILSYYGLGWRTSFNLVLIMAGILMVVDGMMWYVPVRREQAEVPRSIVLSE
ncbi:MAG: hypothetical protein M0Z59_03995 [Nitrospiraceae bacterium]|nr:hypothetical protein [Nitrospiraceae bacterium]